MLFVVLNIWGEILVGSKIFVTVFLKINSCMFRYCQTKKGRTEKNIATFGLNWELSNFWKLNNVTALYNMVK